MKYMDLFDIPAEDLKNNMSKIDYYCHKHDLPSIIALQLRHAVGFINSTACCSMRFRYPDCNIGVTYNEHTHKFIFELHIPIF